MTFKDIKKILHKKTVGIAGAGGLGSNCAVALARVGIGKLIIADYDKISLENLNRQYYFNDQVGQNKAYTLADNMYFINTDVEVIAHNIKLGPQEIKTIYKDCDVIVEAFDDAEMKQMIVETVQSEWPEKPLVVGSGIAGWGSSNSLSVQQIDNLYICGDGISETSDHLPPLAPRVGIVANMQANTVLEILLKNNI
ncbi:MAG: sulfur carrier protein ThiS adenylyltransferase ThiF [Bacteroidales bacterium]|nr:sulfur carrier protein ThiS adenylyltransferase ThiF [Bacteroidales bacterium]MCF8404259.1 sulfur carrier protein ThiS adenylyltransferase ThiF [Bacteroidales bacterium]